MPILEQGYEPYRGTVRRTNLRFASIAAAALLRNRRWWVWVLLLMSLFFGSIKEYFFVFMVYVPAAVFGTSPDKIPNVFAAFADHPRFYTDMMVTQSFWALVMAVTIGAGEIAEDLRTGALTFYLGRPVTRLDYLLGKTAAVSWVVVLVTLVPVLVLFSAQALFEGNWRWLGDHLRVIPASLAYTVILCLFVSGVCLGMSAVARRRLMATISIAGALVVLTVVAAVLAPAKQWTSHSEERDLRRELQQAKTREETKAAMQKYSDAYDDLGSSTATAGWRVVAPLSSLAATARDLFGNPVPQNFSGGRHWFVVLGLPVVFFGVLWRRIRAVEVVT